MFNPLALMRQQSIFSQPSPDDPQNPYRKRFVGGGITPSPENPDVGSITDENSGDNASAKSPFDKGGRSYDAGKYFDEMENIRRNKGPAVTAYQQQLANIPTHDQFQPTKMRRLMATIAGVGAGLGGADKGVALADKINDSPYEEAMGEYRNKISGLQESANLERQDSQEQLKALSEARALGLKYDEFDLKRLEAKHKEQMDQGNLSVAQNRAATYAQSVNKPEYTFTDQADGSVLATNKSNPADRRIIPAHTVTAANLKVNERQAATGERNANTNKENIDSLVADRPARRVIDQTRAERTGLRAPVNATQQSKAIDNELALMFREPKYRGYITEGGSSDREPWKLAEDDGTSGYQEFRRELAKRVKASLASGDPFGGDEGDSEDDGSIVITPRGGR